MVLRWLAISAIICLSSNAVAGETVCNMQKYMCVFAVVIAVVVRKFESTNEYACMRVRDAIAKMNARALENILGKK